MSKRDPTDAELRHYEGLIFATAQLTAPLVEEDFDDVQQMFRIKAWRAVCAYDPARSRMSRDRYVFMVLKNLQKDIIKKKRRGDVSIEGLTARETESGELDTRDSFDERYLSSTEEAVYREVIEGLPLIPSTLSDLERRVLCLLYSDYKQSEVGRALSLEKRDVERCVRSIRMKMADWRPSSTRKIEPHHRAVAVAA